MFIQKFRPLKLRRLVMKKFISLSLVSFSAVALLSNNSIHAESLTKSNSLKGQQLQKEVGQKAISNSNDVEQLLQNNAQQIIEHSSKKHKEAQVKNPFAQYKVINQQQDKNGTTHYSLKPKVDGVTVEDSTIKVHIDKNNNVSLINGSIDKPHITADNTAKLSKDSAVTKAFDAINQSQDKVKNAKGYDIVSNNELTINSDKQRLVYNIDLNYIDPKPAHWKIQIDAQTGEVIKKQNVIENVATEGSGTGVNGDTKKPLHIDKANNKYSLLDTTHNGAIETFTANQSEINYNEILNDTAEFTDQKQRAGVDAHFYANKVYDYYLNNFDRDSYDNNGAKIQSIVNYGKDYNNAAWTGQFMIYGDGDGEQFAPFSGSKDVVAHELTHAVTEKTAQLTYQDQSGALNESFSDVFGYFVDPENWLLGEDIYTPGKDGDALRSLSNPEDYNQPAHMDQYYTGTDDNGGVHTNSGIPNKAGYLTIKAIGKDKAQEIYYLALTQYLSSNSNFVDAKIALTKAATELYGEDSSEVDAVDKAWNDVGVTES